jgi:hypothetical protein
VCPEGIGGNILAMNEEIPFGTRGPKITRLSTKSTRVHALWPIRWGYRSPQVNLGEKDLGRSAQERSLWWPAQAAK